MSFPFFSFCLRVLLFFMGFRVLEFSTFQLFSLRVLLFFGFWGAALPAIIPFPTGFLTVNRLCI